MKVFGIGLHKTGTTTLGRCLTALGYRHTSFDLHLLEEVVGGSFERLFAVVDQHSSFDDWPYPLVFERLDRRYPNSKFVLTRRRSPRRWLQSLEAHCLRTDPEIGARARTLVYGHPYPQIDAGAYLAFYEAHLARARRYFRDRAADLLEVCWEERADWGPLCRFLGKPVPGCAFPHANSGRDGRTDRVEENLRRLRAGQAARSPVS